MKELNDDNTRRKENEQKKRFYEKPVLNSVELFADMVLETCQLPVGSGGGCNGSIVSSGA